MFQDFFRPVETTAQEEQKDCSLIKEVTVHCFSPNERNFCVRETVEIILQSTASVCAAHTLLFSKTKFNWGPFVEHVDSNLLTKSQ